MSPEAEHVLEFWFADARSRPEGFEQRKRFWFSPSPRADSSIRQRFAATVTLAAGGALDHWIDEASTALALILVLDQFPRNMYRGSPQAFATDAKALEWARIGIERGHDRGLSVVERGFFYMPFQHSEDASVQQESVRLYGRLRGQALDQAKAAAESFYQAALEHKNIIDAFGRFPHRNEILGRRSTQAERRYLAAGGNRYGQHG